MASLPGIAPAPPRGDPGEVLIGVSRCLVGDPVRYDGRDRRDPFVAAVLARHARLVPVCPEVGLGLGTPRAPIHLAEREGRVRLVALQGQADHTEAMARFAAGRVTELLRLDLDGYVFKAGSPSCGLAGVPIAICRGVRPGQGAFARRFVERAPLLPVEEEGGLTDLARRAHFLVRVFARRRLERLLAVDPSPAALARFNEREELLVWTHDPAAGPELRRLLDPAPNISAYRARFAAALSLPASEVRRDEALRRLARCAADRLGDDPAATALVERLEDHARGRLPASALPALLRYAVLPPQLRDLAEASCLAPFPPDLHSA